MSTVIETTEQHYMPLFLRNKIVLERGEGVYLYDDNGKKYIDCLAGIAVNALGYAHPCMVKALGEQAGKLIHTTNLFYTKVQADLLAKLSRLSAFDKAFFTNSGAESNEGALKLARKYGHNFSESKTRIITANHSFHGRTMMTMTATGQPKYQQGYAPLPQGFSYVDFGNIEQLTATMDDNVCAVMLEIIQGEGGVHTAPQEYFEQVRALCKKHNALLIFDEIQTGICRTGKWFAYQDIGVKPDIITLAKGLGCGYPIGAFLADDSIAHYFKPGDHGGTFGGNPLGCAVSLAVLDFMEQQDMPTQVQKKGAYFISKLQQLQTKYPQLISEIRGQGLILGVQLTKELAGFSAKCLEHGAIVNITAGTTIRLVPPLIIENAQIDEVCNIIDACLGEFA